MLYMGNMVWHPGLGLCMVFTVAMGLPYIGESGWLGLTYGGSSTVPASANLVETASVWAGFFDIMIAVFFGFLLRFYLPIVTATVLCAASTAIWCVGAVPRFAATSSTPSSTTADQVHIGYFLLPVLTASVALMLGGVWKGCEWATRPNGNQAYERERFWWMRQYRKASAIKRPYEKVPRRDVGCKRWLLLGCVGAFVFFLSAPVAEGLDTLEIVAAVGENPSVDSAWFEVIFLVLAIVGVVFLGMWVVLSNRAGNAVAWAWLLSCVAQWCWVFGLVMREKEGCAGGVGNCYDYGYYWLFFTSIATSIVLYFILNDRDAHESANAKWRQAQRHETMARFNVYLR